MLTGTLTPGLLPADGTVYTDATMRAIAAGSLTLSGLLEDSQVATDTLSHTKVLPASRRFLGLGMFNVKDAAYGATGDGSTDDTAAIQSAITAAIAAAAALTGENRRAVVYFPPGHYKLLSFTSGSLAAGGNLLECGATAGDPISLWFIGQDAVLDNSVCSTTTGWTGEKEWVSLQLYPNLFDVRVQGLDFRSTHVVSSSASHTGRACGLALRDHASFGSAVLSGFHVTGCRFVDSHFAIDSYYSSNRIGLKNATITDSQFLYNAGADSGAVGQTSGGVCIRIVAADGVEVSGCDFDGAVGDTVAGTTKGIEMDGFTYLVACRNEIQVNNRVRNFSTEALFSVNDRVLAYYPKNHILSHNLITATRAASAAAGQPSAVVAQYSGSVVNHNTIIGIGRTGINLLPSSGGAGTGDSSGTTPTICQGNIIEWAGASGQFENAIRVGHLRSRVTHNTILFASLPTGTTAWKVTGVQVLAVGAIITNNTIEAVTKPTFGNQKVVGVSFAVNSPDATVTHNLFKNLNANMAQDGGYTGTFGRATDNETDGCDLSHAITGGGLDGSTLKVGYASQKMWVRRQTLEFTPAATGWLQVASFNAQPFVGRIEFSTGLAYGDATSKTCAGVVEVKYSSNGQAGTLLQAELKQVYFHAANSGAISGVRLTKDAANNALGYLEINIASITSAAPVQLTLETSCPGASLYASVFTGGSGFDGGTSTAAATLTLDTGAVTLFANTLGSYGEYVGNGTPEAAVTANIGSTYHRLDGTTATTHYFKESGTGNTGWIAARLNNP